VGSTGKRKYIDKRGEQKAIPGTTAKRKMALRFTYHPKRIRETTDASKTTITKTNEAPSREGHNKYASMVKR